MKGIKIEARGFGEALARFKSAAIQYTINYEERINEIAAITGNTPGEVKGFYEAHPFSLSYIKEAALKGAKLDADDIQRISVENLMGIQKQLEHLDFGKTWKDYLSDIPFYFAFWLSYLFLWLSYWLWQGIMQAKEEIWD